MPKASTFPVLALPAQRFARAWAAVWNATGTDQAFYDRYRTVTVEVFTGDGGGVRLICANGSFMLRCWVPEWKGIEDDGSAAYDEPDLAVQPEHTVVVCDKRKRACSLLAALATPPKEGEDDGRTEVVEVTVGRIEREGSQLTLDGIDEPRWGFLITSPREKVCPEILGSDAVFPWRHVYDEFDPGTVEDFEFSRKNLRALSAIKGDGWVQIIPQGANKPFILQIEGEGGDVVHGVLMPRRKDEKPDDPDLDDEDLDDEVDDVELASDDEPAPFGPADAETLAADDTEADFFDELGR